MSPWWDEVGPLLVSVVGTLLVLRVLCFASVRFFHVVLFGIPNCCWFCSGWVFPSPSPLWRAFLVYVGLGRARRCRGICLSLLKIGSNMGLSAHYCWVRRGGAAASLGPLRPPPGPAWRTWSCFPAFLPPDAGWVVFSAFCSRRGVFPVGIHHGSSNALFA